MTESPGQLIAIAILLALSCICLSALLALCYALFPKLVGRGRIVAETMPLRSFAIGLINFLFFGVIAAALLSTNSVIALLGLLIGSALLSFVALGLSAIALLVGERLFSKRGGAWQSGVGATVMTLACAIPIVGWFVLPFLLGFTGLGAAIIALIGRGRNET